MTYVFARIPENFLDISRLDSERKNLNHPSLRVGRVQTTDATTAVAAVLLRRASGRKLGDPDILVGVLGAHTLYQPDGGIWVRVVDVDADDGSPLLAAWAVGIEFFDIARACERDSGRQQHGTLALSGVEQRLRMFRDRGGYVFICDIQKGKVGLVEDTDDCAVLGDDVVHSPLNVGRFHDQRDLTGIRREGGVAIVLVLTYWPDAETNC